MVFYGIRMVKGSVGYEDWDKIVKLKEASLKVINANYRNLEVGEVVERLILEKAIKERDHFPKPKEPEKSSKNGTTAEKQEFPGINLIRQNI